jgi:oligo-1,6-glucosidase
VEELIATCHEHGIKVIQDLVASHTSDQHAWFKESRCSIDNPKREWYYWHPARYDAKGNRIPPTNVSYYFGGSAWEWDEGSQGYYLHLYDKSQLDLNWGTEECRRVIYEVAMRFC